MLRLWQQCSWKPSVDWIQIKRRINVSKVSSVRVTRLLNRRKKKESIKGVLNMNATPILLSLVLLLPLLLLTSVLYTVLNWYKVDQNDINSETYVGAESADLSKKDKVYRSEHGALSISIPSASLISSINPATAGTLYKNHTADWTVYQTVTFTQVESESF